MDLFAVLRDSGRTVSLLPILLTCVICQYRIIRIAHTRLLGWCQIGNPYFVLAATVSSMLTCSRNSMLSKKSRANWLCLHSFDREILARLYSYPHTKSEILSLKPFIVILGYWLFNSNSTPYTQSIKCYLMTFRFQLWRYSMESLDGTTD